MVARLQRSPARRSSPLLALVLNKRKVRISTRRGAIELFRGTLSVIFKGNDSEEKKDLARSRKFDLREPPV